MNRSWPLTTALVMACATHEASTAEGPVGDPPTAASDEPVSSRSAEPASTWLWQADDAAAAPSTLLGVVGQQGVEHCPGGGYERTWLGVHPTIGRISVGGPDDAVFEPVMDQPVLALGRPAEAPRRAPITERVEMCLPNQMRSDWQQTPRGILVDRAPHPAIAYFEVAAVRPLHELRARVEGGFIVATFSNPSSVPLHDVELRVHYEGCFGKPGSMVETAVVGELAPGAEASIRAPSINEHDENDAGRHVFRAHSVQLVATGEGVVVDLDARVQALGAAVECP